MNTVNIEMKIGPDGVTSEQVYPCRCGVIHRGPYGLYDLGHHECFHEVPLLSPGDGQAICPACGKSFGLEIPRSEEQA